MSASSPPADVPPPVPDPVPGKAAGAYRTIGELSADTGISQHILRYWETRFPQLRPLTRAGNRRYYRPEDVALVRRIDRLLNHQGYTVRGVQRLLEAEAPEGDPAPAPSAIPTPIPMPEGELHAMLRAIRDRLARAIDAD